MLSRIVDFVRAQPAMVGGMVTALVALGVSFATHPSNEWAGAIQGVIIAGAALLAAWQVRSVVSSPVTVAKLQDDHDLEVLGFRSTIEALRAQPVATVPPGAVGLPGGGDALPVPPV